MVKIFSFIIFYIFKNTPDQPNSAIYHLDLKKFKNQLKQDND